MPSGHGEWTEILVRSSRNSSGLLSLRVEAKDFMHAYFRKVNSELARVGSPHAVVVAANTLNVIGRSKF